MENNTENNTDSVEYVPRQKKRFECTNRNVGFVLLLVAGFISIGGMILFSVGFSTTRIDWTYGAFGITLIVLSITLMIIGCLLRC